MEIIIPLLLLVIFLTFIGCALYGACLLVGKLFGLGTSSAVPNPSDSPLYVSASSTPENATELNATCRQLVRMLRRGDLDQATYDQLRNKIDRVYHSLQVSPPPRLRLDSTSDGDAPVPATLVPTGSTTAPASPIRPTTRFCESCGTSLPASTTWCWNCGLDIAGSSSTTLNSQPTPAPSDPTSTSPTFIPTPPVGQPASPQAGVRRPPAQRPIAPNVSTADTTVGAAKPKSPFDFEDEPSVPTLDPRRPLAELLAGFMLEKNIRWGELVGGILIVGCAVGLVISLQTQLGALQKQFAYLVPLLFMMVTAAIHGAGTYTLRKWNLRSTSRGVLTIGLLLIPLNFLAATALAEKESAGIGLAFAALAVGTVGFGLMAYSSCHALFGRKWWMPSITLLISSLSMVPINRLIPDDTLVVSALAMVLAGIPLAGFLTGNGLLTRHMLRNPANLAKDAEQLLLTLGLSLFGLAITGGLWLSKFTTWSDPLDRLSLPGATAATVFLAIGLLLHQRAGQLAEERTWRVTGTALAILGGLLGTIALVLAWPQPEMLVAVALVNTLVLSSASLRAGLPPHQIGAAINLGILVTVLSHWVSGGLDEGVVSMRIDLLFSSTTSLALSGAMLLVCICGIVVPRLTTQHVAAHRKVLWGCCTVLSVLSLSVALVAGWRSFQTGITTDLHIASGILFTYSLVGMGVGAMSAHRLLLRISAGLFWLALVHAMLFNLPLRQTLFTWIDDDWTAWLSAQLGHGILCSLAACLAWTLNRRNVDEDQPPAWRAVAAQELSWASLLSAGLAVPLAIWQHYTLYGLLAGELCIAAAVWLVGTLVHRTRYEFAVFQGLCFVAVNFLVARVTATTGSELAWQQPEFWNYQLLAVGIGCAGWNSLRLWCPANSQLRSLLNEKHAPCDLVVLTGLAVTLLLGAGALAFPGVVNEFAPTHPEWHVSLPLIGGSTTWAEYQTWSEDLAAVLWISLAGTSLATLIWLVTGQHGQALSQLLLLGLAAAVLVVIPVFSNQLALASALRWSISSYGLLVALLVWRRRQLELVWMQVQRALKPTIVHRDLPALSGSFTRLALGLTTLPLLFLLTIVAARAIQKLPLGGPLPESLFHKDVMLLEINYGVPLAFMVTTLLSYAIARRQSYYAFCGSIITMYLVGTGFVLFAISSDSALMERLIPIIQIAAIFATVYGMLWLGLHGKIAANTGRLPQQDRQLFFHVMIPGAMALFLALAGLFFVTCYPQPAGSGNPSESQTITKLIGSGLGYGTLAGVLGLYLWYFWTRLQAYAVWLTVGGALTVLGTTAAGIHGNSATPWLAFRVMMMGVLAIAAMVTLLPWVLSRYRETAAVENESHWTSVVCSTALGGWAFCLACYSLSSYPAWSMAVLVGLLLLTSLLTVRWSPMLAYLGQAWILAGVVFVWIGWRPAVQSTSAFMQLLHGGVLATILYAAFWMILEIYYGQSENRLLRATRGPLYHRIAAAGLLGLFVAAFGLEFVVQLWAGQTALNGPLLENPTGWLTALAGGGLLLGLLWDRESKVRLFPLFLWGLLMSGLPVLVVWDRERLWPACGLAMGVYLAICGWFWRNQYRWVRRGQSAGIADAETLLLNSSNWFIPTQSVLTILITLAQLIPVWGFADRTDRFLAAMVPFCGCLGLAATASAARRHNRLPELALLLFTVFGVFAGWADLDHGMAGTLWLQRLVRLLMVSAFFTLLYGFLLPRWYDFSPRWRIALGKLTQGVATIALASLIGVLALELTVPNSLTAVESAAVGTVLALMIGALVAAALLPTRDPFQLSAEGRQTYIYGAQAVSGLLVLHLYLAFPEIFHANLFQYWPYLVMAIAFAGCGLAEFFHRQKLAVLSDPLGNTGFVISVVPAALIWFDLEHQAEPAVVLLTIGVLHLVTGAIRGSLVLGLSSILFGNLALWTFYGRFDFQFSQHPQLWLIPPAASVLVAVHLNRSLLTPAQVSFTRLACVAVVYVSSTSEVFLAGIGDQLIPPMVLAVLSVIGVLLGIAMRIQIFLYLGSSFLFLSVLSMIMVAHRKTDVWVWWVFGICMGIGIITLFALFEKKRAEMLDWITRIRNWDG